MTRRDRCRLRARDFEARYESAVRYVGALIVRAEQVDLGPAPLDTSFMRGQAAFAARRALRLERCAKAAKAAYDEAYRAHQHAKFSKMKSAIGDRLAAGYAPPPA